MEYLRGLRRLREDPTWTSKIGIGSVLFLSTMVIPLLGQVALQGWTALILRRAVAGQETPLPRLDLDLDYLGKLLGPGFKAFIASFVWALPVAFLVGGSVACLYIGFIVAAMNMRGAPDELGLGVLLGLAIGFPLLMIVAILLSLPAQVAAIRAEISDDMNQGFRFGAVLSMTRLVWKELLVGSIVLALVQQVFTFGSLLLCGLPLIPSMVALMVARAHFGAQLYARYLERGGEPLPVGPLELGAPVSRPAF